MASGSYKNSNTPRIIIQNTNMNLKTGLINIADNLGLTLSQFLRMEFKKRLSTLKKEINEGK